MRVLFPDVSAFRPDPSVNHWVSCIDGFVFPSVLPTIPVFLVSKPFRVRNIDQFSWSFSRSLNLTTSLNGIDHQRWIWGHGPFLTVVLKFMNPECCSLDWKGVGEEVEFWASGRLPSPVAVLPQTLLASSLLGRGLPTLLRRVPLLPADWSVFVELPPFVSHGKCSVDEIHAFISDGAASPHGMDSDTSHALSDESLGALAELLDHADHGHWPYQWSEARWFFAGVSVPMPQRKKLPRSSIVLVPEKGHLSMSSAWTNQSFSTDCLCPCLKTFANVRGCSKQGTFLSRETVVD